MSHEIRAVGNELLEEDVSNILLAHDDLLSLVELHKILWAHGWMAVGTMPELATRLESLGFRLVMIDGAVWVSHS